MRTCSLAVASVFVATAAHADPTDPAPEPSAGSGTPVAIAPPDPNAPPKKVEEAKDVAKTAELTPIVPKTNDVTRPAYQLYAEIDIPILAIGVVSSAAHNVTRQPAFCAPTCNTSDLTNRLDRLNAGFYSPAWSNASTIGVVTLGAATVGVVLYEERWLPALNDFVVIGEAVMSAHAFATVMEVAAGRPRPLLYGDPNDPGSYRAPESVRNGGDAGLSFVSGHTATAFSLATSLFVTERRLHPHSKAPYAILGGGLAVASFVGVGRVMSGAHFTTDVIGGAVVGSSLGVLITSIHKSPVTVVPVKSETAHGIGVQGKF